MRDTYFHDNPLDDCVDAVTGEVAAWAMDWVTQFNSYTEYSVSGTGLHIIMRATLPGNKGIGTGFGDGGGLFNDKRLFFCTGNHLVGTPLTVEERQAVVDAYLAEHRPQRGAKAASGGNTASNLTDDEVLQLCCNASNREKFCTLYEAGAWEDILKADGQRYYASLSNADIGLLCMLAFYTQDEDQLERLFGESALGQRDKWQEREDYREMTIQKAIRYVEENGTMQQQAESQTVASSDAGVTAKAQAKGFSLVVRNASAITPRETEWLWTNYLAKGELHILGGHAAGGKSTLTTHIAATLSNAGLWPDGTPAPRVKTLFIVPEDTPETSVVPRLIANGADLDMVAIVQVAVDTEDKEYLFDVSRHREALETAIRENGIGLVIIDPLSGAMPSADRNNEGAVRDRLQPLTKLAQDTGAAVVGIMHTGKPNGGSRRAEQQLLGSTGFVALARIALMLAPRSADRQDSRRVLGVVKTNLGPYPDNRELTLTEGQVAWGATYSGSIEALLGATEGETPTKAQDAETFIREHLSANGGYMPSQELKVLATAAGYSEVTYRRACKALGTTPQKGKGKVAAWYIGLPEAQPQPLATTCSTPFTQLMSNMYLPDCDKEITSCSHEQVAQVVDSPVSPQVAHLDTPMSNLSFPDGDTGNTASNSQLVQLAHAGEDAQVVTTQVPRKAPRLVPCDNQRQTPHEAMAEVLWEEWYNQQDEGVTTTVYH